MSPNEKLISMQEIRDLLQVKSTSFWKLRHEEGANFPTPVRIGGKSLWFLSEVLAWLHAQKEEPHEGK